METKVCPSCGRTVSVSEKHCHFCGHPFADVNQQPQQPQPQPQQPYQPQQQQSYQSQQQQSYQSQQQQSYQSQQQQSYQAQQKPYGGDGGNMPPSGGNNAPAYDPGNKITVFGVIADGISIGMKNFALIFVSYVLFLLTCWIPYLNVGTLIALQTLPIRLGRPDGEEPSFFFIFDAKYRQYMGEYFLLTGLMIMGLIPAFLCLYFPGIVVALSWSLAFYLLLDKEVSPTEALIQSNKLTKGYKWTIFFAGLLLAIIVAIFFGVLFWLLNAIDVTAITIIGFILGIATVAVVSTGLNAAIYHGLSE